MQCTPRAICQQPRVQPTLRPPQRAKQSEFEELTEKPWRFSALLCSAFKTIFGQDERYQRHETTSGLAEFCQLSIQLISCIVSGNDVVQHRHNRSRLQGRAASTSRNGVTLVAPVVALLLVCSKLPHEHFVSQHFCAGAPENVHRQVYSSDPGIDVLVVLDTKDAATYDGVTPMIFGHRQRDHKSDHILDQEVVALVVLNIKQDGTARRLMSTHCCPLESSKTSN